jgi:hypothetical protein
MGRNRTAGRGKNKHARAEAKLSFRTHHVYGQLPTADKT